MPSAVIQPSQRPMRRARILLAEDDPELRTMVSLLLSADGFEVVEVRDGQQLLDYLNGAAADGTGSSVPDLILSDVCMPSVDGLQVLEQVRRAELDVPVVLMTAFATEHMSRHADELGAATLLTKPFEIDDLRMIVLNLAALPARNTHQHQQRATA